MLSKQITTYWEKQNRLHLVSPKYKLVIVSYILVIICCQTMLVNLLIATSTIIVISIISPPIKFLDYFYELSFCMLTFFMTCSMPVTYVELLKRVTSVNQTVLYKKASQIITTFSIITSLKLTIGIFLSLWIPKLFCLTTNSESLGRIFKQSKSELYNKSNFLLAFVFAFELYPLILRQINTVLVVIKIKKYLHTRKIKKEIFSRTIGLIGITLIDNFLKDAEYLSISLKLRNLHFYPKNCRYLNTNHYKNDL